MRGVANPRKATDEEIVAAYQKHKSVWKAAEELGMCGQSVHERLTRMGVTLDGNGKRWTEEDDKKLAEEYEMYRYFGKVSQLAAIMGRTVFFLSRKAKGLGLTTYASKRAPTAKIRKMSPDAIQLIWEDYKASSFKMSEYCRRHGFDDETFANVMRDTYPEYDEVMESKKTKCTKYCSGRTFEYRVKNYLQAKGFFVMRAPQSKGPADLIAYDHGRCLLIQCKMGDWHAVDEWNEFYRLAVKHGAEPIFCTKGESGRLKVMRITGEKDRSRKPCPMVEVEVEGVRI
jgi:Holliday junction resolvase